MTRSGRPTARRVVFGFAREGKSGIFSVPADGSGKPELLLATDKRPVPTSFTPDGKTVVFTQPGPDQKARILTIQASAGGNQQQPRPLHDTSFPEFGGQVSPDGKWIAYQSLESGTMDVYVQPFPGPGAKVRISIQGGSWPRWSRNGRELFYWEGAAPTSRLMSVEAQTTPTFKAGSPQVLFSMLSGTTWDVAPDGKRFLVELTRLGDAGSSKMAAVTDWFDELRRRAPARK